MAEERSHSGPKPTKFKITKHERHYSGYFHLDKVEVAAARFTQKDEPESFNRPAPVEVAQRGDAVAAILFDREKRNVILIDQFRLPTSRLFRQRVEDKDFKPLVGDHDFQDGWLLETVAGSLRTTKLTAEDFLKQQMLEEAGYRVSRVREIGRFFSSPGGTSELIHLFYAEVADSQRAQNSSSTTTKDDIDVVTIPIDEFFIKLERREFLDAKVIIAGYWLRDNVANLLAQPPGRSQETLTYSVLGKGPKIGIKTGSIVEIAGIDVLVNPENTNMEMDHPYRRSVSAAIRWEGAERKPRKGYEQDGKKDILIRDLIADDLRHRLGRRHHVELTEVIETTSGMLLKKSGVRGVMHVAIAEGYYEQGLSTDLTTLKRSLDRVLETIEHANWNRRYFSPYRSVLVPMLGAGSGGLSIREVAPVLVTSAVEFFKRKPKSRLREIYFNAFFLPDVIHLREALDDYTGESTQSQISSTGAMAQTSLSSVAAPHAPFLSKPVES